MNPGSMQKYIASGVSPDLHWPGTLDGFPVRGDIANLQGSDPDNVSHEFDYRCRKFELWDAEQLAQFMDIMDKIANGWFFQRERVNRWCDEHSGLVVWLEWLEVYGRVIRPK